VPSLSLVSYHVRELERAGLIRLARRVPRRGTLAHYYGPDPAGARELAEWHEAQAARIRKALERGGLAS
jgi:DNA-binding transcriptional ArsR family regulator